MDSGRSTVHAEVGSCHLAGWLASGPRTGCFSAGFLRCGHFGSATAIERVETTLAMRCLRPSSNFPAGASAGPRGLRGGGTMRELPWHFVTDELRQRGPATGPPMGKAEK